MFLSKLLWGETIMTTTYIINRNLSSSLEGKNPKEADYTHLKTFSYVAYFNHNISKLESRFHECVFMGYPEGVKSLDVSKWSLTGMSHLMNMIPYRDKKLNDEVYVRKQEKHTKIRWSLDLSMNLLMRIRLEMKLEMLLILRENRKHSS